MGGLDGEAVAVTADVVIRGQGLGLHATLASATQEPQAGDEDEGEEEQAKDEEGHVDHPLVVRALGFGRDHGVSGEELEGSRDDSSAADNRSRLVEGRPGEGASNVGDGGHCGQILKGVGVIK